MNFEPSGAEARIFKVLMARLEAAPSKPIFEDALVTKMYLRNVNIGVACLYRGSFVRRSIRDCSRQCLRKPGCAPIRFAAEREPVKYD